MTSVIIESTGVFTPPHRITNEELVQSFNRYVRRFNEVNVDAIKQGAVTPLLESDSAFIERASGIQSRYVMDRDGILDDEFMAPRAALADDGTTMQCQMGVSAARDAMAAAGVTASDIDMVIVACSGHQRVYPAIAIEIQSALGIEGSAFDMNVACASSIFGVETARNLIGGGAAQRILVVSPEIASLQLNFRDRDSHFIFGDAATAVLLAAETDSVTPDGAWRIRSGKLSTTYSDNIRNEFTFANRMLVKANSERTFFHQSGRKVFKEMLPMVARHIEQHLAGEGIARQGLCRLWLYQNNLTMNELIATKVLGRKPDRNVAPIILDEYGNTSSAGCLIAFHEHRSDLNAGEVGIICSYGGGYSIGSLVVEAC